MTSPPSWQPKQWKSPRAGVTWNDGDFSSWNGHRPFSDPPPALRNVTCSQTIVVDPGPLTHQGDVVVADPAGHPASLRSQPGVPSQAEASVSDATWSMTTRSRAASSGAAAKSAANAGSSTSGARDRSSDTRSRHHLALAEHARDAVLRTHHVVRGDALEHRDLAAGVLGDDQVDGVAGERTRRVPMVRGLLDGRAEPARSAPR